MDRLKIAIVHDYLNQMGGAERVLTVLHEMFPQAPIYTTIVDRDVLCPGLSTGDIRPSWMQTLPGLKKHFKKYLPFYPRAIESFDLKKYDLIISSSSAFAKGAIKAPNALHVCYCYTPMRFAWDFDNYIRKENLSFLYRNALPLVIATLKQWDQKTKNRPDCYIAISSAVQDRIKKVYGKEAEVIFPPVEVQKYQPSGHTENFYLIVSRLNPYKRIDIAIEAFNYLGLPLKIIGSGPFLNQLKSMARPNVTFLGRVTDEELAKYYAKCKGVILPGEEDFGVVVVEANAAGRPVIAFKGGGALDTIREGMNGLFFEERDAGSLIRAVESMENAKYDFKYQDIRAYAFQFDKEVFKRRFKDFISKILGPKSQPTKDEGVESHSKLLTPRFWSVKIPPSAIFL